jgi:hypothetical protein
MSGIVAVAGIVTSAAALAIFVLIYIHLNWQKQLPNPTKDVQTKKRRRVLVRIIMTTSFFLIVMYVAMQYGTGYFTRSDGITIFWPRYIAEMAVSSSVSIALSVFLLLKQHHIKKMILLAISMNILLLISAFTVANAFWAFYVLAFVPLFLWFFLTWMHARRVDCTAHKFFWFALIVELLNLLVFGLSQQLGNHISISLENWFYYALELVAVILFPVLLAIFYMTYSEAHASLPRDSIRYSKKTVVIKRAPLDPYNSFTMSESDQEA